MPLHLYLPYVVACIVLVIVPGPTVTLIIANSLRHGARAGLLNVAGTQIGLAVMMATLVVGLAGLMATMGWWFAWLRFAGAAYLIWLGWKLLRNPDGLAEPRAAPIPRGGFVLQGFLVLLGNPKVLLFFGAFIPQFIDPAGNPVLQTIVLGATAMAIAAISDGFYAVAVGRAGMRLSQRRIRLLSRFSGGMLVGGGLWLALARVR